MQATLVIVVKVIVLSKLAEALFVLVRVRHAACLERNAVWQICLRHLGNLKLTCASLDNRYCTKDVKQPSYIRCATALAILARYDWSTGTRLGISLDLSQRKSEATRSVRVWHCLNRSISCDYSDLRKTCICLG